MFYIVKKMYLHHLTLDLRKYQLSDLPKGITEPKGITGRC